MKKYRISCWKTYYGYYDLNAEDEKEAKRKANQHLWNEEEMDGITETDVGLTDWEEL